MSDSEEDYMSMIIEEPKQKETFAQRKMRQQREAEARSKVPSKAELAVSSALRRDEALSTSTLSPTNKGFQMMAKLGFKPGEALGKKSTENDNEHGNGGADRRAEPLHLTFKEDRGGIGLDSEKKRKIREEAEEAVKKVKAEEGDYRERVRVERESKRVEGQVFGAQKVAERLDTEAEEAEGDNEGDETGEKKEKPKKVKPTSQINILYRGLVRERQDRERDIQARHALQTSLPSFFPTPRLPTFDDPTLEREDKQALPIDEPSSTSRLEEELEEEDPELDEFNALEPGEKLGKLVAYLRERYWYCFWCKYRYEDEELEGCPGVTEEDHD